MQVIFENIVSLFKESTKNFFTKDEVLETLNKAQWNELPIIESNEIKINPNDHSVLYKGNVLHLPKKEFTLLYYLMENKNKTLNKQHLLNHVWGTEVIVTERTVDTHINRLREKFGYNIIETKKGVGYKFID